MTMPPVAADQRTALPVRRPPRKSPSQRYADWATGVLGLGLGAVVALAISSETLRAVRAPGGLATFAGRVTGLAGTYLLLLMVLLVARIPFVERVVGQDRLLRWHRQLGQWPLYLLALHGFLITVGYAEQAHTGAWHQLGILLGSYPDVLAALVGFGLLVMAGVTSIRAARRRMRYETWWAVHLYVYLALALSFAHQIVNGVSFVGHPLTRAVWGVLWATTAGTVLLYRIVLPVARSLFHGLRVVGINEEAPGVVSIVCSGRYLDRLNVAGGQFFQWRFLSRGMWWQAHPYSISALPHGSYLRVTIDTAGDHSAALARLRLGTRVAIEGPYGAFTERNRETNKLLLIGAGVGLTPIRALAEDLSTPVNLIAISRASSPDHLLFRDEMRSLVEALGGTLHEVVGPRTKHPFDRKYLRRLVPDIAQREIYVCGPEGLIKRVESAASSLGVPPHRIHREEFVF